MNSHLFPLRGIIEGFYGVFYTVPERIDLIRFAGRSGYNLYIYSSKNDRQHRTRWWEPYPQKTMQQFAQTVQAGREAGVDFCYAISPGVSISYSSVEDFQQVIAKLYDFYKIGVRTFSVLLDDISPTLRSETDRQRYSSYAQAHYEFCNRVHAQLQVYDPACSLSMCPTDYFGAAPFSAYIHELGRGLHPAIDVFYTGPQVCSPVLRAEDMRAFAQAIGREPILWDNYPVNDLAMQPEMHIGPIENRGADLYQAVRGVVVNPMNQAEASKIPLLTYADYLADPGDYDPQTSWEMAVQSVAGEDGYLAVRTLGENSMHSCLRDEGAEKLTGLVKISLDALENGESTFTSQAVKALGRYLAQLDETCYTLRYRLDNLALRNNLLPWIDALDSWQSAGRWALETLANTESGEDCSASYQHLLETMEQAQSHHKQITNGALLPLIAYTTRKVEQLKLASR